MIAMLLNRTEGDAEAVTARFWTLTTRTGFGDLAPRPHRITSRRAFFHDLKSNSRTLFGEFFVGASRETDR